MKIVLFWWLLEPELGYGGAKTGRILAEGLAQAGHEVVAVTTHGGRSPATEVHGRLKIIRFSPWNLYWVAEKNRQPLWKRAVWQMLDVWNPHAYRVARRIVEQEQPDVVHVGKLRGFSPSVWHAARSVSAAPIVQTCVDYELMSPEGTLKGRLGQMARQGAWPVRPYQALRASWSAQVAAVTGESRYTLETIVSCGFFPAAKQRVVHPSHGLGLQALASLRQATRDRSGGSEEGLRVLYLGRLEEIKGLDILCAAVDRLAPRFPTLRLDIVGGGSLEQALRERYAGSQQITVHGPQFGGLKERLMVDCDVMVVPSVWPEVFGRVIVEAYAHGKPVIVSRAGGMPELVEEGRTGFVVPAGDVDDLEGVLGRLAKDPSLARGLSGACFDAAPRWSVETVVSEFATLYEELLA